MNDTTSLALLDTPYAALKVADNLAAILAENLGGAAIDVGQLPKVKIPAGGSLIWTIEEIEGERGEKELSGIVVAWHEQRAFWPGDLAGGSEPPDCSSPDAVMGHARMSETGVPLLWNDNAVAGVQSCISCPFAQFGSGRNGTGQACKKSRVLYLLQRGEILPTIVSLSPTSIKPISDFFLRLTSRMIPLSHVEIGLTLERVQSAGGINYSKVAPKLVRLLSDEEGAAMDRYATQLRPLLKEGVRD